MTSAFDPATFASMTFTGANSTESSPVPVGEWHALCTKQEITRWQSKDGSKAGLKSTLIFEIEDPTVTEVTGRPKSFVRYEMMLDLTPEGGLDMGKGMNVNLGRTRAAMSLNDPTVPFSFDQFVGRPAVIAIKHEEWEGRLQARCHGVAKAA